MKHHSMRNLDLFATTALFGNVLAMSAVPLMLKLFTESLDAWTVNSIRYASSAILFLPWLLLAGRKDFLKKSSWKKVLIPSILNIFSQIFWAWTPYYLEPGLIGFLIRLSTLWAVFASFVLFRDERVLLSDKRFWTGFSLSIFGFVALVSMGNPFQKPSLTGIVIVVLSSIFWAGYQISVRLYMQDMDPRTSFGMVSLISTSALLAGTVFFGTPSSAFHVPIGLLLLVVLSGWIGIALSHVLMYFTIQRIGVAICSTVNLASAFLTALCSRFLFQESLNWIQWTAGAVLIFGGFFLIQAQSRLQPASESRTKRSHPHEESAMDQPA